MKKDLNSVLIRPHITEKATISAEKAVYVFEVEKSATKSLIRASFKSKYNINPEKITTVTIPSKKVFVRGKVGKKSGYRKAYIYLKKGDKIETL